MSIRDELTADRVALVNARTSILTGDRVKEVQRAGRKLVFVEVSPASITDAIGEIDRQLADIDREEGAARRPRFRALSVSFRA